MPIEPNFMERLMLLRLTKGPGNLLDMLGAMGFKAILTVLKLGVFEALKDGPLSSRDVAERTRASERGIELLLRCLDALGYAKEAGGRWENSALARRWMLHAPANPIADMFTYWDQCLERWGHMDETIRHGRPPVTAWEDVARRPRGWEIYQAFMRGFANMAVGEILGRAALPQDARRLLDVGGGHGTYSIAFCRNHPGLSATILDLPEAMEPARKTIAAEHMEDRVTLREGDFWTADLGSGFDVALLFNVIHMYAPEKNRELLGKVAAALGPGGQVIIMDQMAVRASGPVAKVTAALVGLHLLNEVGGQSHDPGQVTGWLRAAGCPKARWTALRTVPGVALAFGARERPGPG